MGGKLTIDELHESLIEYIGENGGGGGSLVMLKNSITISKPTNSVAINIAEFNRDSDVLLVFKNSTYIDGEYNVSPDGKYINKIEGNWNETNTNTLFSFLVFKNIPKDIEFSDGRLIEDGSIDYKKLSSELQEKINTNSPNSNSVTVVDNSGIFEVDSENKKLLENVLIQLNERANNSKIIVTEDANIIRNKGCFYFIVTDQQSVNTDTLKVSPNMGIKIE